jgi:hypothetical protein
MTVFSGIKGKHRYENPWSNHPGFVALGTHSEWLPRSQSMPENDGRIDYDLYCIMPVNKGDSKSYSDVAIGARYSNDGPDYISGDLLDSRSELMRELRRRVLNHMLKHYKP